MILHASKSCSLAIALLVLVSPASAQPADTYDALVQLFEDWRAFERPAMLDGAPDHTAERFDRAFAALGDYRQRLERIDTDGWTLEQKVDWHIVRAEMNGFEFNYKILKPWVRDPAFYKSIWTYKSDVPAHEGPTHHAVTELWTYEFPLSADEEARLVSDLSVIPPLMAQAMGNLTGNAKELWIAGIRDIRDQRRILDDLEERVRGSAGPDLLDAIDVAQDATDRLVAWLEAEATKKTGPSGIGREQYTWYQRNVHYLPMSWEDEVRLLQRELARSWSSLKLEEHRNRNLPPMRAAQTPAEYDRMADRAADRLMSFLDDQEVIPVKYYMEPALREHLGQFVPEEDRNFFYITSHYDPVPLFTHFYHWFELAQMREEPHASPIRRGALLYNIFDSRNEGTATGVEEMFMHAGLYDDSPRSRELVYILLAQRAARGLGSLYAHANEMTMEEAGGVHVEWTPRGWMSTEPELLRFEQHLYLRQPGYGTSYVTGKYLFERLLARYSKEVEERGEMFRMQEFFDAVNAAGNIPLSLVHWQLTGEGGEVRRLVGR